MKLIPDLGDIVYGYCTLEEILIMLGKDISRQNYLIHKFKYIFIVSRICDQGEYYSFKYLITTRSYIPQKEDLEIIIKAGHLRFLKYFISVMDFDSLILASQYGNVEILKFLLKHIAPKSSLIEYASANGHLQIIKYLVSVNIQINPYSLDLAVESGNIAIVYYLLRKGVIFREGILSRAIKGGNIVIISILLYMGLKIKLEDLRVALLYDISKFIPFFKNDKNIVDLFLASKKLNTEQRYHYSTDYGLYIKK
jgi:hypothetical protein